eukprot:c22996_g1_i1.p1 GENE.c22996_g1_i1~~c22996_g1_i1.p1  ORF type:complete len:382 (-),score=79.72 c22996_g1_i1:112-1173(-)
MKANLKTLVKDLQEKEADEIMNPKAPSDSFFSQVCVAIPSARRYAHSGRIAPRNYLREMLNVIWRDTPRANRSQALVYVMNVDRVPKDHKDPIRLTREFGVRVVQSIVDTEVLLNSLPVSAFDTDEQIVMSKDKQLWRAKEVLDNMSLLEICRNSGRPYTLFLEDDVRPTTNLWPKLEKLVNTVPDDFAMLDLYNPGVWEEEDREFHNGDEYTFFCCTQSMLFSNARLEPLIHLLQDGYLRAPVDHLLVEYLYATKTVNTTATSNGMLIATTAKNHTKHVYLAVPNLFQHVGAYSSLAERTLDPPEVAHESLSWEALLQAQQSQQQSQQRQHLTKFEQYKQQPDAHFSTSFVE